MKMIDLHVHSNCSDGSYSPAELVDYATEKGLAAFALTDHDSVGGLDEALAHAAKLKEQGIAAPEVIPGIEFSTEYHGKDVHIVGLYIDHNNSLFREKLQEFVDSRINRNYKMCASLQAAGIDITCEKLMETFPDSVITRAHYARYLLDNGYVKSMQEAFDRYVGDHCPYYIPREKVTPVQAIELILEAGGIPILAHPLLYHLSDANLETLVAQCKEAGLVGIEAIYATHSAAEERQVRKLADKYQLLISGGSDFHGSNKPNLDLGVGYGKLFIPEDVLTQLKKTRVNLLFTDMDGTLLNNRSEISPGTKAALDRMTAKGHHLILSSGRPLPSILEVREDQGINYPNMLIISNNGALVYDCDSDTNILVHRLEMDDIRYIIAEAQKLGVHIHAYTDKAVVCREINAEVKFYTSRTRMAIICADDIADSLKEPSFKLQCIHLTDRSVLENFRDHIQPHLGGRVQIIFSSDQYLEILPTSAGKGSALLFVEKHLHVPHNHTFAAGDAENDLSMLKAAGTGIAMLNATHAVKEAADIITSKDNDNDGLVEIIDKYFT